MTFASIARPLLKGFYSNLSAAHKDMAISFKYQVC